MLKVHTTEKVEKIVRSKKSEDTGPSDKTA